MKAPILAARRFRLARVFASILLSGSTFAMASSHLIFLGGYTAKGPNKGIYAVRLDGETGLLGAPVLAAEAVDPAWITLTPDRKFLYAIHPSTALATGFSVDPNNGKLTPLPAPASSAANPPSHLAVDATGRVLVAAHYRDGFVAAIPLRPDGSLGEPQRVTHTGKSIHPTRQEKSHVHSVTLSPDNRFVIVADLGLDKIFSYALEASQAKLTPANPPFLGTTPGSGPRHFKFGRDGHHAYAINELANTITAYDYDAVHGALTARQTVSTLPASLSEPTTTAEVRVHPNGKFLYGSNRGHDSIAVFAIHPGDGKLTPIEIVPTGGKNPRNFALSPDGKWLLCGHQDTAFLSVFRVDPASGRLTRSEHSAAAPSSVCILFYN